MKLHGIKPGDLVLCDVRGSRFHARVGCRPVDGGLTVQPIERHITTRTVTARQVLAHWRRSARSQT